MRVYIHAVCLFVCVFVCVCVCVYMGEYKSGLSRMHGVLGKDRIPYCLKDKKIKNIKKY